MNAPTRLLVLALALLPLAAAAGPNVGLDNILLRKVNGVTKVEIWPGCTMRYVEHTPRDAGVELRIRVAIDPGCAAELQNVTSERYAPSSLRLGNVDEVVFDRLNDRDTFITLHFAAPQKFEVRQHRVGWIEVFVDTNVPSASLAPAKPPPLVAEAPGPRPNARSAFPEVVDRRSAPPRQASTSRPAARVDQVRPSSDGDFVVQLGVFAEPGPVLAELERLATPHLAFVTKFEINARQWHGVQLGFFASEAEAEQVLDGLASRFPDAWVRYTSSAERTSAREGGDARERLAGDVPAVRVTRSTSPGEAALAGAMADGRVAVLERRYADAIDAYTFVLESPGHTHGAEAREMLAIALERSGEARAALAEYDAFLIQYPEHMLAPRIEQKMTTLEMALNADASSTTTNISPAAARSLQPEWQLNGGLSHYYWRNEEQIVHDGNQVVRGSGILGLADLTAARRGGRYEVLARFNGAYQHNLVEYDETGDVGWVSQAFVDIQDTRLGWRARAGRQIRREDGIPGRFDGLGVLYDLKPWLGISVSAGMPVDSPRFSPSTSRALLAGSARFRQLWEGRIEASVYAQQQTVDGILDRQAIGGEVILREGNFAVVSLIDFDVSYNVLNNLLVNGTWRLDNGWTLSGRLDFGALPYMTTRNALSGQAASTVDELLETYSEGQVRTLARDRTAQASTASLGLSVPFGDRFDLSLDVTMRQSDGTVASGGVAEIPETGNQVFVNAMLVGTSLLRDNDLFALTLRSNTTRSRDTMIAIVDSRLPFGRALRINPRITYTQHLPNVSNASEQSILQPELRILYRWRQILFELQAGGRWSNRELPTWEADPFTTDGTEELTGGYVNVGYRWEF